MDTQDIEVRMMILTPMEHMNLNRVILMNFDLGRFLKVKVKYKIGDSQFVGLEFLSMYKKISSLYDK